MKSKWYKRTLLLFLLVFVSGLFEIDIHFKKREYFKKYQSLMEDRLQLEIDWAKIQITLSGISSGLSLEKDAKLKANMTIPNASSANILIINEKEKTK